MKNKSKLTLFSPMGKVILILIFSVVSNSAMAGWIKYNGAGPVPSYFNTDTIRRDGNIATISKLWDFRVAQTAPNGSMMLSTIARYEYDCEDETMRTIDNTFYSENMGRGKVVYEFSNHDLNWLPIVAQGRGETGIDLACGKK